LENENHHLSEEILNMYLDEELSAVEREGIEAHLAICEMCRTEAKASRDLFTALTKVADVPAPNLAPGVLAHIRPRRRLAALRWLAPMFQGAAATALIAWSWARLIDHLNAIAGSLPIDGLGIPWDEFTGWAMGQWSTLSIWPDAFLSTLQDLSTRFSTDLGFTLPQVALLGITAAALWLIGNALLLRRAALNGQNTR
jgi:predicted anti-sigma-YlaC factor YlaD